MGLSWGCTWDFDGRVPGSLGWGDYKETDGSKVDDRETETSWNCFLTKFFLTPKSQASIFLTTWLHPQKGKILFFVW